MKTMSIVVLAWGLMPLTGQAASFDCKNAGTRVEHIICNTPDISRLDEEMAAAYQTGLASSRNGEAFKGEQKTWITQRNNCPDANCIRDAYRRRIEQLHPAQGSALSVTAGETAGAAAKMYPPYPDIWELQSPLLQSNTNQVIDHLALSNGDIWFSYSWQETLKNNPANSKGPNLQKGITFFGRQPVGIRDLNRETTLPDGSRVKPVQGSIRYGDNGLATLKDGTRISSLQGEYKTGCYQGPGENWVLHDRQDGVNEWLQKKVVFLLLDAPIQILTGLASGQQRPAACDMAEEKISTRVVSLAGTVVPLQDGGFLLEDVKYGTVIRFDSSLNTHSRLLNKHIFMMDKDAYERFFMTETGRNENLDKEGYVRMQSVVNDLYTYLRKFNSGEK